MNYEKKAAIHYEAAFSLTKHDFILKKPNYFYSENVFNAAPQIALRQFYCHSVLEAYKRRQVNGP